MSFPYPPQIIPNNITSIYTIYGKKDCEYCDKIKEFFANKIKKTRKIIIRYYDIDELIQKKIIKNYLEFHEKMIPFIYNHITVPIIFVNSQFIGGYDDFMEIFIKLEANKKKNSSIVNSLKMNKEKDIDKIIQRILKKLT
jgi:glutaredoxin